MERQNRNHLKNPRQIKRGALTGLHPRRCRALQGDCKRQGSRLPVHDESKHRSRRVWRKCGARTWQYRPLRRNARHGGKGSSLQGIWRRECCAHLPWHTGYRGDYQSRHMACTRLRRHQPWGYQRAALLWDWRAPQGCSRYSSLSWWPARHRYRRSGRHHQRPQSCRQTKRSLQSRCQRRRKRRCRDHKAAAHLRLYKRNFMR